MIHLEKVNLLSPSILNLFRKAHISAVRCYIRSENKFASGNIGLQKINVINTLNAFKTHKYDFVANILVQYVNTKSIPWEEVQKKVFDEQAKENNGRDKLLDISSIILETCKVLKQGEIGLSYCKYLAKENRNLSFFNLFLIMRLLHTFDVEVTDHKELLKFLLKEIKPYLGLKFAHECLCVKVLCRDYDCWKYLVDSYPSLKDASEDILTVLTAEAFNFNEYEIGCKIWNLRQFTLKYSIYTAYLNYCIREAEKGRFSTSLIDNLVERCQSSFSVLPEVNILILFKTLVSTLNSDPNKTHVWEIYETKVDNFNNCLNCHNRLDSLKITEEEFTKLRDHVLNDVLINNNIHIKTNEKELSRFLSYIKKVKYDVVLDGLNILGQVNFKRDINKEYNVMIQIINYFKKKNMKILFIGRKFVKKYSFFNYVQENCEIFFVDQLSDDDAFLLYATLYGGINTHFFTSDYLRGYSILIEDKEMTVVFKKWNIIRRFSFLPKSTKLVVPKVHSFLPQKTKIKDKNSKDGEMCWHFPVGCDTFKKMIVKTTTWYCLWRKPLDQSSSSDSGFTKQQEIDVAEEKKIEMSW